MTEFFWYVFELCYGLIDFLLNNPITLVLITELIRFAITKYIEDLTE